MINVDTVKGTSNILRHILKKYEFRWNPIQQLQSFALIYSILHIKYQQNTSYKKFNNKNKVLHYLHK